MCACACVFEHVKVTLLTLQCSAAAGGSDAYRPDRSWMPSRWDVVHVKQEATCHTWERLKFKGLSSVRALLATKVGSLYKMNYIVRLDSRLSIFQSFSSFDSIEY